MKTKHLILSLLMLTTTGSLFAQKLFTLEELNFGGKNASQFTPERWKLRWDGDRLLDADEKPAIVIDRVTGKTIEGDTVDLDAQKRSPHDGELEYCKASGAVAFLRNSNLWVASAEGKEYQLSSDGSREIVYGQRVHRDEFGIYKGTFWSPDGQQLAFYRMDQSMVADYPQVNTFEREATLAPDKYPMAGMTSHKVTVGIFSLVTEKTIYLDLGDPTDRYFTNLAWAPDGKTLYLYELNRDQDQTYLDAYDTATGRKVRTLREEFSDKYVEPLHPITFLPWDDSKFIYWSWKDGYKHLYLMNTDGKELGQLTSGKWVVKELVGFCPATKSAIIITKEAGDLQRNIYRLDLKTKKRTLLDNGRGCHSAQLSADGQYLIDTWQEPTVPRACAVTDTRTGKQSLLRTAKDPWEGWYQPIFEQGTILAADGETTLYWRMVKPMDFDASKKYPTVVYVYGGPHAHNVEASWHWGSRSWETYMAQKGYILFILDNRGSEDRGRDFEQVTFRHLGQEEMKDQMQGVAFLKSLPYVDSNRLGVHGWSYGGFMTTSLMTTYPDAFKVGVAGGPVIDWKWYEVMYGERYMDTPQQNPEGYEQTSCINKAKNLKGKLQIIIGMNDPTCVPQHSLQFLNACAEAGTQPDFFVYPGEGHNMAGHKSVHLHERITQYFEDYLKPLP
ncbi:MAG: DPP IV N-terminal domain-containing protein [Bacteroidaceae bacterium]|nr:DPP IV N-terminal domain-containing protein [Bacteroidaceae bacterium]